jgi:hypothetical protein
MEFDIFISYAHHDNETHDAWVHAFHDRLAADFRSRSGKKLNLFLDREGLNPGAALSERLTGALNGSAILIPILSPAYLSSRWCRREFLHFMEQAGERLIVDGNSRIVPVQLMPYDRYEPDAESDREELRAIQAFLAGNEILYADFYHHPLPIRPDEHAFDACIAALSDTIAELLKTVRQNLQQPAEAPAPEGDALFLAAAAGAGEAKTLRETLLKEFQQQRKYNKIQHRVLPDDAPADPKALSTAELEAFLRRQLAAADFSVHFFDDVEGPKTADTRKPITHLQYRLACEQCANRPDFKVYVGRKTTEDCATSQEAFLQELEQDARANPQIEILPAFELKAVKDALLDAIRLRAEKAELQKNAPPPADAARRVFLIHDHRDKGDPVCNRLDDLIFEQKFDVYTPVFREDDPHVDPDTSFRDHWLLCNKAVVLLRGASPAWCNAIKVELIKTATEKKPPFEMAICVAEPDAKRRIRAVRSHEFRIIDCSQQGFEQQLILFLQNQHHA